MLPGSPNSGTSRHNEDEAVDFPSENSHSDKDELHCPDHSLLVEHVAELPWKVEIMETDEDIAMRKTADDFAPFEDFIEFEHEYVKDHGKGCNDCKDD